MTIEIRTCKDEEFAAGISPIWQYFGEEPKEELRANFRRVLPADHINAAFDGKEVVGSTSSYPFQMTIPGGPVPTAGITLVGVRPTHRRQGILSKLMKQLLENAHERGEPIASLWVAEETIYGRFGCGICSINSEIRIDRAHTHYRKHWERTLVARQVKKEEALESFPTVYEQVAPQIPGMLSRTRDWWEVRQLFDDRLSGTARVLWCTSCSSAKASRPATRSTAIAPSSSRAARTRRSRSRKRSASTRTPPRRSGATSSTSI